MSISRCPTIDEDYAPRALHPGAMLQVVLVFGVLLAFGLIHLAMRFQHDKVRRETSELQALQGQLASEVKLLQGQAEAFKNPRLLYHYAVVNLRMVPYAQNVRDHVLRIQPDVFKRYELARANIRSSRETAPAPAWIDRMSDRLGVIGEAVAGGEKKLDEGIKN